MTTIKTLISAVVLIAASTGFAQSSNTCSWFPKGEDGPGVIGKRYADVGFDVEDVQHTSHNAYQTSIGANIPVTQCIDISGGYSYSWFDYKPQHNTDHAIGGSIKLYKTIEDGVKPFISAGLGYSWFDEKLDNPWYFNSNRKNHHSQDKATWRGSVGAEFPYKWISVTPTISYDDDFEGTTKSSQAFVYGVRTDSWITPKIGIYFGVSYVTWQHSPSHDWNYSVGARVRF